MKFHDNMSWSLMEQAYPALFRWDRQTSKVEGRPRSRGWKWGWRSFALEAASAAVLVRKFTNPCLSGFSGRLWRGKGSCYFAGTLNLPDLEVQLPLIFHCIFLFVVIVHYTKTSIFFFFFLAGLARIKLAVFLFLYMIYFTQTPFNWQIVYKQSMENASN